MSSNNNPVRRPDFPDPPSPLEVTPQCGESPTNSYLEEKPSDQLPQFFRAPDAHAGPPQNHNRFLNHSHESQLNTQPQSHAKYRPATVLDPQSTANHTQQQTHAPRRMRLLLGMICGRLRVENGCGAIFCVRLGLSI